MLLGMQGTSQKDETRFASHLLNVILGSSMSSRLFQEIREKRGLAYSVYSFSHSHEDSGMTGVYAGVSPENAREVLFARKRRAFKTFRATHSGSRTDAAREYVKGNMYINAESNDYRMNRLAKNEFLFGDYIPFEEIEKKINAVSSEDIRTWFRSVYNPEKMAVMLYGPVDEELEDPDGTGFCTGCFGLAQLLKSDELPVKTAVEFA